LRSKLDSHHIKPIEIIVDMFIVGRDYLNGNHFVYRGKPLSLLTQPIPIFPRQKRRGPHDEDRKGEARLEISAMQITMLVI